MVNVHQLLTTLVCCYSCSETTDLYVMYTLAAPAGKPPVSSSIKRNAVLQMAEDGLRFMLHVVEGDAGNLHDAFCELSKFFTPEVVDPDLLAFMQAFNTTQVCLCSQLLVTDSRSNNDNSNDRSVETRKS